MALCEACGQPLPETFRSGDLVIRDNPPEALWRGEPILTTPTRIRLLSLLARLGRASTSALLMTLPGQDSGSGTVQVHLHGLRRALQAAHVPVHLIAIHGWGYELIWTDRR
ncbi:MAG: hypothetical protein BGP16_00305 [Sphingobium sp. 66-54]|nr:MAG: hypothetical protein BGP16_00305 [Sphingobium sp. 66-54]